MVKKTKAQHQAEYLKYASNLFEYAIALDNDDLNDDNISADDEDSDSKSGNDNNLGEILELSAFQWMQIALAMSGDGSRGPYNQFPKSADFFAISLQAPERYFRQMFR